MSSGRSHGGLGAAGRATQRAWRLRRGRVHGAGRAGAARPFRPGALVTARRAYLTASLRRGEVATADGGCVGIVARTGRRASVSWAEAQAGMLVTGQDAAAVTSTGLDLAIAAIQHRKTVVIIDLAAGPATTPRAFSARGATPPAAALRAPIEVACARFEAPLLCFADPGTHYEPLSGLAPARAADLILAMIDWTGFAPAKQSFCADYLRTALAVSAAAGRPPGRTGRCSTTWPACCGPGRSSVRLRQRAAPWPERTTLLSRPARPSLADPAGRRIRRRRPPSGRSRAQLAGLRSAAIGTLGSASQAWPPTRRSAWTGRWPDERSCCSAWIRASRASRP